MVPVPEGGVDWTEYLLLEAAVWGVEGSFGGSQNDPRHFSKSQGPRNVMALTTTHRSPRAGMELPLSPDVKGEMPGVKYMYNVPQLV